MVMAVSMSVIADENGVTPPAKVTPVHPDLDDLLASSEGRDVLLIEVWREVSGP